MARLRHLLPSFNALVTFEAAVRCGTFARAAQELCVTGPAVSRTIGRLEAHLGVVLFHRTSAGAVLTEEGSALFSGISASFDEIEKTLLRVQQARRSGVQTVVLSASSAFATHWFMPRLADFQERFPKVDIRFQLISGPLGGPANGADIAMRFDYGSGPRHVARAVMPELLVPIRAPHFRGVEASAGAFMPAVDRIINLSTAEPDWSGLFSDATPDRKPGGLQFSDYTVVVQAALLGQGVALGWLNVVSHLLARGDLVPVGSVMRTGRTCELVTTCNPETPVVVEICDWIGAEFHADLERINMQYPDLGFGAVSDGTAIAEQCL
ncbi:LysR family transcriptional regulator [Mesorhizobium sp. WSM2239]|uniref:LysR family transcriptional regulator n=2 Tax=unclassified Mesorhizobium TaxID=325217 RepID=A0AAU8DL99_9HYPH